MHEKKCCWLQLLTNSDWAEIALTTITIKFANTYKGFAAVANIRTAKYACLL